MKQQLTIDFALQLEATFEHFFAADNQVLIDNLKQFVETESDIPSKQLFYIHGGKGAGKSHVLQALCHFADQKDKLAQYLPANQLLDMSPEFTLGLENCELLLIDDVQLFQHSPIWQTTIFDLINRCIEAGNKIIFTANKPADQIDFTLPDLVSRLNWGQKWPLYALDDEQRKAMLTLRSQARGIPMSDELANFIVLRCQQDNASILSCLDKLDKESLLEKRKITIPFVKSVMSW
ncbi:DnaA regulatory inactivator Hda [Catenovulum maritimum]|uniref:Uncharacterized protein n=1 Tax=Catenovulum maritimum TaxID=1513271 RepID=A0A0J8JP04_9ALTE|nr:DnaA regulatory inactivator Hda [Catenovulum maritimum]KMT66371.1 hypothetical protein XM47_03835 [Catenovulum maritimum]